MADDARAEAERRWPNEHPFRYLIRNAFVLGAEWAAGRAETTTATTEDIADALEHWDRGIDWRLAEQENLTRAAYLRGAEQLMSLLATARTRPTREDVARVLFHRVYPDGVWSASGGEGFLRDADAVLALLADQPDPADVWDQAADILRAEAREQWAKDAEQPPIPGAQLIAQRMQVMEKVLRERAARIRGGGA